MKIEESITDYYKTDYSDFYETNKELINNSIASVQKGFQPEYLP